jgi:hypothetical protein
LPASTLSEHEGGGSFARAGHDASTGFVFLSGNCHVFLSAAGFHRDPAPHQSNPRQTENE